MYVTNKAHLSLILSYRKVLKTARSDYFSSLLEENKHNPRYLLNTVAKLTNNKASTGADISQQHSSNDIMTYFTYKIDTIRYQIVTMQPSATVSHQIVHCRSPEEQFHSFSTIGGEELYKLVKSAKPTTIMLDPIPSKLLKVVLPEVIDPILAIINLQWWSVTKYNYFVTVLKYIFQVSVLYWSSFILSNFYFYFTTFQSIRSYFLLHYIS